MVAKKSQKSKLTVSSSKKSLQGQKAVKQVVKPKKTVNGIKNSAKKVTNLKSNVKGKLNKESHMGFFAKNIEQFEHSIEFDISKGILAAFLFMLVAEAISFIGFSLSRVYYTNLQYTLLWSRFLTPITGQIPPIFFLYSVLISLFMGFIYAFFYHMVRVSIHGHAPHTKWVKGLLYGVFLVFAVSVPMLLRDYLMLSVPSLLVVSWFAESVLTFLAGGVIIAHIIK